MLLFLKFQESKQTSMGDVKKIAASSSECSGAFVFKTHLLWDLLRTGPHWYQLQIKLLPYHLSIYSSLIYSDLQIQNTNIIIIIYITSSRDLICFDFGR